MSVGVSPVGPQELLNSLPDGVVVTDARGSIIFASDQALEIFGFPREELLGQSVEILVPDSFRETHREYREAYVRNPEVRPMGAVELQAKRKDGSLFPVEISLAASHTPDGLRIISTIRDISQRKQMEEALHASEERYRRLIEEVKDYAIFMLDPEGRMMTWNEGARQMRGHRTEEILGRHVSVFFTPEDIKAGRSEEELREAAEKGRFETEG